MPGIRNDHAEKYFGDVGGNGDSTDAESHPPDFLDNLQGSDSSDSEMEGENHSETEFISPSGDYSSDEEDMAMILAFARYTYGERSGYKGARSDKLIDLENQVALLTLEMEQQKSKLAVQEEEIAYTNKFAESLEAQVQVLSQAMRNAGLLLPATEPAVA